MKRPIILLLSTLAVFVASCNPDPGVATGNFPKHITFTSAEGAYEPQADASAADHVVLSFRKGSFDTEGNPTGKGYVLIVPCFTKPAADGIPTIASGTYNAAAGGEAFTFTPGNEVDGAGARLISYDDKGGVTTTCIDGGSFSVKRSSGIFTFAFEISHAQRTLSADYEGSLPVDEGYEVLDRSTAYFYGDYDGSGLYNWGLDLFRETESGKQEGVQLDLNMENTFDFENGRLQEGVYTASSDGSAGTFYPGKIEDGRLLGGACILVVDSRQVTYLITGGTLTIREAGNGYVITTDFEVKNAKDGSTAKNIRFKYSGEPVLKNSSATDRTWNGEIENANASWYGDTGNNSDKWIFQLSWPDGEETRHYLVEVYAPKSSRADGLVPPTGTFTMAEATGGNRSGTMEPGSGDLSHGLNGTWFTTTWGEAVNNNPRPAKPGVGSITITSSGDSYDIVSYFEDDRNNKFHGTYNAGPVTVLDKGPEDYTIDSWNEHGIVFYNGLSTSKEFGQLRAYLMNGSLYFDDKGYLQGAGMYLDLDFYVDPTATHYIPLGVYTKNPAFSTPAPNTLGFFSAFYLWDPDNRVNTGFDIVSGTANVTARDGDDYTIEFDLGLHDGSTVKGTFVGSMAYQDASVAAVNARAAVTNPSVSLPLPVRGEGKTYTTENMRFTAR